MGWLCAKCIKTTEEIILHRRDSYSKLELKMELFRDKVSKVNGSLYVLVSSAESECNGERSCSIVSIAVAQVGMIFTIIVISLLDVYSSRVQSITWSSKLKIKH